MDDCAPIYIGCGAVLFAVPDLAERGPEPDMIYWIFFGLAGMVYLIADADLKLNSKLYWFGIFPIALAFGVLSTAVY